jgi:hypothetical protein
MFESVGSSYLLVLINFHLLGYFVFPYIIPPLSITACTRPEGHKLAHSSWANSGNSLSSTNLANYTQVEKNVKKFLFIKKNFQHVSPFLSLL